MNSARSKARSHADGRDIASQSFLLKALFNPLHNPFRIGHRACDAKYPLSIFLACGVKFRSIHLAVDLLAEALDHLIPLFVVSEGLLAVGGGEIVVGARPPEELLLARNPRVFLHSHRIWI